VRESAVDAMSVIAQLTAFFKVSLKKVIPERILRERGIVIRLGPGAGRIYARMRVLQIIGISSHQQFAPTEASSFLFVCFGNIMRSPMADALLKQEAAEAQVAIRSDSAGLHAVPGKAAHPWAQAAATELGVSLADHQAKPLNGDLVANADAILAMDKQNLAELLNLYPQCKDKFFMLPAYSGDPRLDEISDPYLGDLETTRECYHLVQTCIRNLVASRTPSAPSK
jgi:protein-tyrosine-phosphatase